MSRKDLVIAVLLTFCLSVVLFRVLPIGSQSVGDYDPWADINDDGRIDMRDISYSARLFLTSGDPAKNVTIARRANKLVYTVFRQTVDAHGYFMTPWISVDGYSKMTISIITDADANYYSLLAVNRNFNTSEAWGFFVDSQTNMEYGLVKTYDVPNEMIQIWFGNSDATARLIFIDVYLIP